MTTSTVSPDDVASLRHFNRFYTSRIGILDPYLGSDLSLTDVRILYELAHTPGLTASDLVRTLSLDAGYISRILKRFEKHGWVAKTQSPKDGRQSLLSLTREGWAKYTPLQEKSSAEAEGLLAPLGAQQRAEVMAAMGRIEALLGGGEGGEDYATNGEEGVEAVAVAAAPQVSLQPVQPGDMGWLVQVHGELYSREYGYGPGFEAIVADVAGMYLRASADPATAENQRGWIAHVNGERVGGIIVINAGEKGEEVLETAQIRLLVLTPDARGLGLGKRLVELCIAFAREKGYARIRLWTQSELVAARGIYASRGFKVVSSVVTKGWGAQGMSETWELEL